MRFLPLFVAPLFVVLASCAPEDKEVFGNAIWQVRCPEGIAGCFQDSPPNDVFGFNGETNAAGLPITATCSYSSLSEGDMVNLSLGLGTNFLRIERLLVNGSRPVGNLCRVSVEQGANTYGGNSGTCGASEPSEEQPCQVQSVDILPSTDGADSSISLDLYCELLKSPLNPEGLQANITSAAGATTPVVITVENCVGL